MDTKTQTQHTPGPWGLCDDSSDNSTWVITSPVTTDALSIAKLESGDVGEPQAEANAQLIAAAPELLEALEDLRASVQKWAPNIDQSRARAAIAKAKAKGEA